MTGSGRGSKAGVARCPEEMSGGESSQNRRSMSSKINYGRNTMDSSGFEGNLRCERKGGMGVEESSWRWVRRGVAEGYCGEEREARAEGFTEARFGKTEGACGGAGGGESFWRTGEILQSLDNSKSLLMIEKQKRRPRRAVRSSRSFPPTAPTSAPRTTPGASGRPR